MLKTQQFLREKGLEALQSQFSLSAQRHEAYPHLVQLKYSQIESKMSERIVQECRGLILDESNNWQIVCYPFDKFFNYGETHAAKIDWNYARIFEKVDGSLMMLYYYDQQWLVASSGLPDASGKVRNQTYTMGTLFWRVWEKQAYSLPVDPSHCYLFEMIDPSIKVLVPYEQEKIIYIGARNLNTLAEKSIHEVGNPEWERVQQFPVNSLEELLIKAQHLNPMKQEGFIVIDNQFNRIKVKSPQYVKINLLKGADKKLTDRYLVAIIQANEEEEFLAYFEEYRERYDRLKKKYMKLIKVMESKALEIQELVEKREIGLAVKETPFPSLFFKLKEGKYHSVQDALSKMEAKKLLSSLQKIQL